LRTGGGGSTELGWLGAGGGDALRTGGETWLCGFWAGGGETALGGGGSSELGWLGAGGGGDDRTGLEQPRAGDGETEHGRL